MRIVYLNLSFALCLLVGTCALAQTPLGTGFTYQGEVKQNDLPVDGTVHLRFSLWDAAGSGAPPLGGNRIGTPQLLIDVQVSDGVFTVILNASGEFGPTALIGEARWLQIEVCADPGCAGLNILSPRQPISAAPYAHKALSAPWAGLTEVPEGFADGQDNIGDPVWEMSGSDISYSTGNVGIGTASPTVRLTIAGDAEIGTHHGDYRRLRIGGGNSSGFLYGSFPRYGDGIHLGYNYYADSSGIDQVIQPDGGTSRITAGYGTLSLATGGIGTPPVDRLVVDSVGNVKLGKNTQEFATGSEESLRIIRGVVNSDGGIMTGSGFTVSHPEIGHYTITFSTPFSGPPSVTAMTHFLGVVATQATVAVEVGTTASYTKINITRYVSSGDGSVDRIFHFIAVGPR